MLPHFNLKEIAKKVDTELFTVDMHAKETQKIRERTKKIVEILGKSSLKGPMVAIVQEFVANGLKAIYKKIYFEEVMPKINLGELSYEAKLHFFRIEIDNNQTKNFAHITQENGSYVTVKFQALREGLKLTVHNPGIPTNIEMHRIESTLENAKRLLNLSYIFDDDSENKEEENQREGAGLGLSLVVMTLRNLGVPLENLKISIEDDITCLSVLFPWGVFFDDSSSKVPILKGSALNKDMLRLVINLNYYTMIFNNKGALLGISDNFITNYGLDSNRNSLKKIIPHKFFEDIFANHKNIFTETKIDHYYIRLNLDDDTQNSLFHVSALLKNDSTIISLWRPIPKSMENIYLPLVQDEFSNTLKLQEILKPYIATNIFTKAKQVIKENLNHIAGELKTTTIFFADLVGFTRKVEMMKPDVTLDFLNIALGILVKSIETHQGCIDKFMGDAVMAIFENPLNAVISAIEIQTLFFELNTFRALAEETPIHIRIGIHTGEVMIGNVGPKHRRDWTVIGDVVNTASRIERSSTPGSVLISKNTFDLTKENVSFEKKGKLQAKGKSNEVDIYFVKSVKFMKLGKEMTLTIKHDN